MAKPASGSKGKDRSFAAKMNKTDKIQASAVPTALIVKPYKSLDGHYKFKRFLTKMTKETKETLGV
jgi:hypothetical protein